MAASLKILGLSGSLRKASTNSGLLRYAASIAPRHNLDITIGSIGDLPLYNADVEAKGWPESVQRLRGQAREATGVLIAAPEYNYSIPGTLKNAIDWLSRPELPDAETAGKGPVPGPLVLKPAALMGGGGYMGGGRSQYHLRQSLVFLDMPVLMKPEVMVRIFEAPPKNDPATGDLIHEGTQKMVEQLLAAFAEWCRRLEM